MKLLIFVVGVICECFVGFGYIHWYEIIHYVWIFSTNQLGIFLIYSELLFHVEIFQFHIVPLAYVMDVCVFGDVVIIVPFASGIGSLKILWYPDIGEFCLCLPQHNLFLLQYHAFFIYFVPILNNSQCCLELTFDFILRDCFWWYPATICGAEDLIQACYMQGKLPSHRTIIVKPIAILINMTL